MLAEKLKKYSIILASGSPRRQHFIKELGIPFTIDVREVDEVYDSSLKEAQITDYLSRLKATAFTDIKDHEIIITSDTIVWHQGKPVEKPKDFNEAFSMIKSFSNQKHDVYTSVTFTSKDRQITIHDKTSVWFNPLSDEEINYYINTCNPFDKAGSYGIQEWIGYIGVRKIEGSYFNVMGFPTHLVYQTLLEFVKD